ncbi:MAG: hypothetical protein Q4A01_05360 [Coriobacteriales bacterium]|nr:hypothetical protein [Coriobacteriales bacterium]
MTTRRTTFTRTPFVITAFLAANLAVTGAPLVAMAEEAPQDNPPAVEQQSVPEQEQPQEQQEPQTQTQQAPEQTQQAPEPSAETQGDPEPANPYEYDEKTKVLTITGSIPQDSWNEFDKKAEVEEIATSDGAQTTNPHSLFEGFTSLKKADLTKLKMSLGDTADSNDMFKDCAKLEELTLPKSFRFTKGSNPELPDPKDGLKWSNGSDAKTTAKLVEFYIDPAADEKKDMPEADYTWKWQKKVDVTVTVDKPESVTYDGTEHTPQPYVAATAKISDEEEEALAASDYTIAYTYGNNVNAGEATVYATVKDAHDGNGYLVWNKANPQGNAKFTIEQRKVHVTAKDITMVYDGYKVEAAQAPLKPSMTYDPGDIIEADKDKVSLSAKYTCEWKREVGTYTIKVGDVTFKNKTTSTDTAAESDPASNYTAGEKTDGKLTVTAADISNATVSAVSDRTYTGSAITPTPTVVMSYTYTEDGTTKSGSAQLTKDTDYTLSYADNTQVGTATITIKGKGNFTGEKKVTFKIKSASSSSSSSSTTSSGVSSSSGTPSTADPTSVAGIGALLASGIAAFGAARFTRNRKN